MKNNKSDFVSTVENTFAAFTDRELKEAAELMIKPEWLQERDVLIKLLQHFDYTADEIRDQLNKAKPLHDGIKLEFDKLLS
jgi:hypothetical protein